MFTGIIEEVGTVKDIRPDRLTVTASRVIADINIGDSMAVNGACLTIVATDKNSFTVDLMPETGRKTTFKNVRSGDGVNLERALSAGGRFGGHFVQGHIDGTGRVMSLIPEGNALIMKVGVSPELAKYLVNKGFVAVEGVSLTIIECDSSSFSVSLVSYSRNTTTLGSKKPGGEVNLEIDILAKYVEKLAGKKNDDVLIDFLQGSDSLSKGRI